MPVLPSSLQDSTRATSAVLALKTKCHVTLVDRDLERISAWKGEDIPLNEPGLKSIVVACRDGTKTLSYTTQLAEVIPNSSIIFICVDTPSLHERARSEQDLNLCNLQEVIRNIAQLAHSDTIVVHKSTVPCGTSVASRKLLDQTKHNDVHFEVLSNPEFLVGGNAVENMLHPDRVVIGSAQTPTGFAAANRLKKLYCAWVPLHRIITIDVWSSELAKLASNAMLAQRVSNASALSVLCEETGADISSVTQVIGADTRIGDSMLRAGPGFGGSCLRKDTMCLVDLAQNLGQEEVAEYWREVVTLNNFQINRLTERMIQTLGKPIKNRKIAVLGLSFKDGVKDTRESPSIAMIKALSLEGAKLAIFDPGLTADQTDITLHDAGLAHESRNGIFISSDVRSACESACAVLLLADPKNLAIARKHQVGLGHVREDLDREPSLVTCDQFSWKTLFFRMAEPRYVLDCRNYTDHAALERLGFVVEGVGRQNVYIQDNQAFEGV